MAVTETVKESWGSRLGGSIKGMLAGLAMFVAGFPVLFCNEGRSVKTAKALDEGEGACVSVESPAAVDHDLDGRLVHMTGKADTKDVLTDDTFGISVVALRLERNVEMYQWVEESHTTEKKNLGGSVTKTTTYTYSKEWRDEAVDSSDFKEPGHDNPGVMEFRSEKMYAGSATFGAFRLNGRQIERVGQVCEYAFPSGFTCNVERVQMHGRAILVPNAETRKNALNDRDVASQPRIGDMRVTFGVVYPHEISIVAKQYGDTFVGYTAKNGKKIDLLSDGVKDAAEMFASARSANSFLTWILRLAGFLLMFLGLGAVLKPLSVLADVLPILGDIVGFGTGLVAGLAALACSLATIAAAWLFYRPLLACALFAIAGFAAWALFRKTGKAAK